MEEETYYIIGESRTNSDNSITKIYGSFYIAFEVRPDNGEIVGVDCSHTLELTRDFVRRLFLHRNIEADAAQIEGDIRRRYHGSSARAILVAYRDALKRYLKAVEENRGD